MYKRKLTQGKTCSLNTFAEHKTIYHRPSFFLRGGVDLSRKERMALPSVPQTSEDIADGVVNLMADARVSAIDIAVEASKASVHSKKTDESE